jgi:membrane-associated phospholipid phosphatase
MQMNARLAEIISTVGSPFVLFPVVITYTTVRRLGWSEAVPALISILVVLVILGSFIFFRRKKGAVTNLDVSERTQRAHNVYWPTLSLIAAVAVYFKLSDRPFVWDTIYVGALIATCFAFNAVIKISLHTVFATYLSALLLFHDWGWGAGMFVFAALIASSRIVLGRHKPNEVMLGWITGTLFGVGYGMIFS